MGKSAPNNEDLKKILKQGISMQKEIILTYEMFLKIIDKIGDTQLYNSIKAKKERLEGHKGILEKWLLTISTGYDDFDTSPLLNDVNYKNKVAYIQSTIPTTDVFELLINTPVTYHKNINGIPIKIKLTFLKDNFCHLPRKSNIPSNAKSAYNALYQAAEWNKKAATAYELPDLWECMKDFDNCLGEFLVSIGLKKDLSFNLTKYITQKESEVNEFYITNIIKHILQWTYYVKFNTLEGLYVPEEEVALIKATLALQKETVSLSQEDVIVLSGIRMCTNREHTIIEKNARILVRKDSNLEFEIVPISFCQECQRYIMLYSDFEKIDGQILCCIRDMRVNNDNIYEQYISYESNESIMYKYGYNVNANKNLSFQIRTAILIRLINNKILTRSQICSHLEYLIRRNRNNKNMTLAISKWNADLQYIREYKPENDSDIFIKNITIK